MSEISIKEMMNEQTEQSNGSMVVYTCSEIMKMNHGYTTTDTQILKLFDSYPLPRHKIRYANPCNKKLYSENSSSSSTIAVDYDKKVLEFFRKELSSITKSNFLQVADRLNKAIIPEAELGNIGLIFFQTLIDCDFVMDELIECLLNLKFKGNELIQSTVINCINNEFKNQTIYKDTASET